MTVTTLAPAPAAGAARAARRWPFAPAPRALLLLSAGLLWIAPAWIDPRALLIMGVWDLLVLATVAIDLRRMPAPSLLHVTRAWPGPLALGVTSRVRIELQNRGTVAIHAWLTDYVPGAFRDDLKELKLTVGPRGSAHADYEVRPRERGDTAVGSVALRYRSDWQLAEQWADAPLAQTARVYPDLQEGRRHSMYLIRSRQVALEKRRARRPGAGREFESLREYQPGDEPRDVCWTAAARRGWLVTKTYQPERSQAVWILVDAGRLLRARVSGRMLLDYAADAALALAHVALMSGDRVGLLTYGRRLQHRLAPARTAGQMRAFVEALALVRAEASEADHAAVAGAVRAAQKRRALIVWLTEVVETAGVPDVIEQALQLVPQHVLLFAVMRQQEISDAAMARPATASDMYRVVSAQETLERREMFLHSLRQRGALALELSPPELAGALVNRYLDVKERGLL